MKASAILFAVLGSFPLAALAAPPVEVATRIDQVTVFPGEALVLRTGKARVGVGRATLRVAGLPASLIDSSVRAWVAGRARPSLTGFSVEPVPTGEQVLPQARLLEEEIRRLEDDERALDATVAQVGQRRSYLQSLRSTFEARLLKELGTGKPDPRSWEAAEKFLGKELGLLASETHRLAVARRELHRKLELLRKQLTQIQSKRALLTKVLLLDVEAEGAGPLTVSIRYRVPNVRWQSLYDARLGGGKVTLTHFALVTQESGEDWEEVKLSLSTAATRDRVQIPQLRARNLSAPPPSSEEEERAAPRAFDRRAMKEEADRRPAPPPPPAPEAEARQAEFVTTYDAATRVSVPSSPAGHKTLVAVVAFDAVVRHQAVPKRALGAYITASGKLARELPLPAGQANLYFGEEYVGRTSLGPVVPGGEVTLPFGRDERVKVQRQLLEKKRHEQGVFTKEERYDYRYRFLLKNNSPNRVEITLLDQVPVSQHEDIKVEVLGETSPRAVPDPRDAPGVQRWVVSLAPGERRELRLSFSVAYPRGRRVWGLE
jgi:uncharacterized protein (TIGR02231 family)